MKHQKESYPATLKITQTVPATEIKLCSPFLTAIPLSLHPREKRKTLDIKVGSSQQEHEPSDVSQMTVSNYADKFNLQLLIIIWRRAL
jgi:hypothetical protein